MKYAGRKLTTSLNAVIPIRKITAQNGNIDLKPFISITSVIWVTRLWSSQALEGRIHVHEHQQQLLSTELTTPKYKFENEYISNSMLWNKPQCCLSNYPCNIYVLSTQRSWKIYHCHIIKKNISLPNSTNTVQKLSFELIIDGWESKISWYTMPVRFYKNLKREFFLGGRECDRGKNHQWI